MTTGSNSPDARVAREAGTRRVRLGAGRDVELGAGPSLFLDVVRLGAALVVAVGHLAEKTVGWPNLLPYAINAVTAFFVLSGFVIRYVTVRRPSTWSHYLADRTSRIYSVLLPAILLAVVAEIVLPRLPGGLAFTPPLDVAHLFKTTVANLTLTTYYWHQHWTYNSNIAMWSLCFEWAYYVLYGLAFYLSGRRRILCLLGAVVIAGPEVLFLLPVWLAGCLLFEVFLRLRHAPWLRARWLLPMAAVTLSLATALFTLPRSRAAVATLRNTSATSVHVWQSHIRASTTGLSVLIPHIGHGTQVSANAYEWCAIFFVAMLFGLLLTDRLAVDPKSISVRVIRLLAEATFPLYLVHMPIIMLLQAWHPLNSSAAKVAVLAAVFLLSVFLGIACNRFKFALRRWFGNTPEPRRT